MDLKSLLMMMMEDYKRDINNSLKEIQENTYIQVKELNKTTQDLKMEVETIRKSQRETTLEIENLGKKSGAIDASITNRIQEIEERISGAEDTIENIDTTMKENAKCKKNLTQNTQEIQYTMRRPTIRIIGIDENEDCQLKGPVNIFNKIIEENSPNLKKEMPMNIQEAYRTPSRLDQKRNSSQHIIIKTPNAQSKEY
jgi:chromosome segregation ATPase